MITEQVINAAIDADLVIADLTGHDPNVFYELAIRHMEEKPVIHMHPTTEAPPFDIYDYRFIKFDLTHWDRIARARHDLADQVNAVLEPDYKVSNPIMRARGTIELRRTADPKDKILSDLVKRFERLENRQRLENYLRNIGSVGSGLSLGALALTPSSTMTAAPVQAGTEFLEHYLFSSPHAGITEPPKLDDHKKPDTPSSNDDD